MTFQIEFPDYPVADVPALPDGFVDHSWHNNSAPSFENRGLGLSVWMDYADIAMRELPEGKRFLVHKIDAVGAFLDDDAVFESDDWNEVLMFIAGWVRS